MCLSRAHYVVAAGADLCCKSSELYPHPSSPHIHKTKPQTINFYVVHNIVSYGTLIGLTRPLFQVWFWSWVCVWSTDIELKIRNHYTSLQALKPSSTMAGLDGAANEVVVLKFFFSIFFFFPFLKNKKHNKKSTITATKR